MAPAFSMPIGPRREAMKAATINPTVDTKPAAAQGAVAGSQGQAVWDEAPPSSSVSSAAPTPVYVPASWSAPAPYSAPVSYSPTAPAPASWPAAAPASAPAPWPAAPAPASAPASYSSAAPAPASWPVAPAPAPARVSYSSAAPAPISRPAAPPPALMPAYSPAPAPDSAPAVASWPAKPPMSAPAPSSMPWQASWHASTPASSPCPSSTSSSVPAVWPEASSTPSSALAPASAPTTSTSIPTPVPAAGPAQVLPTGNGQSQLSSSEQEFAAWSAQHPAPPAPQPGTPQGQPSGPPGPPGSPAGDQHCFKSADGTEICLNKSYEHKNTTDVYDQGGVHDLHNNYVDKTDGQFAANVTGTNITQAMHGGPPQQGNTIIQGNNFNDDSGHRDTHTDLGTNGSAPVYEDHRVDGSSDGKDWESHSSNPDGTKVNQELHSANEDKSLTDIKNTNGMTDIYHEGGKKSDHLEQFHEHHGGEVQNPKSDSSVTLHSAGDSHQQSEEHRDNYGMHSLHEETSSIGKFNLHLKGDHAWLDKAEQSTNWPKGTTDMKPPDTSGPGIFGRSLDVDSSSLQTSQLLGSDVATVSFGVDEQSALQMRPSAFAHVDYVTSGVEAVNDADHSTVEAKEIIVLGVIAGVICFFVGVWMFRGRRAKKRDAMIELADARTDKLIADGGEC